MCEIDASLRVDDIPKIEVSNSFVPVVKAFPEHAQVSPYKMMSSNNRVIEVRGDTLTAVSVGTAMIKFYKADEEIPFAEKEVSTYQENFVQRIELTADTRRMGIGQSQRLSMKLLPPTADDVEEYQWSVSDASVATIDETGELVARAAGTVLVVLETRRAREAVEIEILPDIAGINLSGTNIALYVGQTQPIQAYIYPANVYDSSCEWRTSDSRVAVVEKQNDGTDAIRATGIGSCTIVCAALQGGGICCVQCNGRKHV
jgi:hypothetical protein